MRDFLQDIRHSVRFLANNSTFTFLSILALALGIGANTAIFTPVNSLQLRPLPFEELDRLVGVRQTDPRQAGGDSELSTGAFTDVREGSSVFERIAAYQWVDFHLTEAGNPAHVQAAMVSPSFFDLLGVKPLLGRTFRVEEEQDARNDVVVLRHSLWRRHFNADPSLIGKPIRLDGGSFTIIGVMPFDFGYPSAAELWIPWNLTDQEKTQRLFPNAVTLAKLNPGVSISQAQTQLDSIAVQLEKLYPQANSGRGLKVIPLRLTVFDGAQADAFTLLTFGAAMLVLLIACADVAAMLLARAIERQKEIAIRVAMGASRGRILRHLLTESVIVALIAGALSVLVAYWIVATMKKIMPAEIARLVPGWETMQVDIRGLGFTLIVSLLSVIVFSLAPSIRSSGPNINKTLKEGSKSQGGGFSRRLRALLLVTQIALAVVLLIGSILMVNSLTRLANAEQAFDPKSLLTMRMRVLESKFQRPDQVASYYENIIEQLKTIQGVESVGLISNLPCSFRWLPTVMSAEGGNSLLESEIYETDLEVINSDYFRTMRIPLIRGREFTGHDDANSIRVAMISARLAEKFWSREDPIGKRIKAGSPESDAPWLTIVGVVGDVRQSWIDRQPRMTLYVSHLQSPMSRMDLVMRASQNPFSLAAPAQARILDVDGQQPVFAVKTMDQFIADTMTSVRNVTFLIGVNGVMAALLSGIGVSGILLYSVRQRTQEIGIRLALGAPPRSILFMMIKEAVTLAIIGMIVGWLLSYGLIRVMPSVLYGLIPPTPLVFAECAGLLFVFTLIGSYASARKALKMDTMSALRG